MPYVQCHVVSSTPSRAQFCVHVFETSAGQNVVIHQMPVKQFSVVPSLCVHRQFESIVAFVCSDLQPSALCSA